MSYKKRVLLILLLSSIFIFALTGICFAEDYGPLKITDVIIEDGKLIVQYDIDYGYEDAVQVGHICLREERRGFRKSETFKRLSDIESKSDAFEISLSSLEGNATYDYITLIQIEYNYYCAQPGGQKKWAYRTANKPVCIYLKGEKSTTTVIFFIDGGMLNFTSMDNDPSRMKLVNNSFNNAKLCGFSAVKIHYSAEYKWNKNLKSISYAYVTDSCGFGNSLTDNCDVSTLAYINTDAQNPLNKIIASYVSDFVEEKLSDMGAEIMDQSLINTAKIIGEKTFTGKIFLKKPVSMVVNNLNLFTKCIKWIEAAGELSEMSKNVDKNLKENARKERIKWLNTIFTANPSESRLMDACENGNYAGVAKSEIGTTFGLLALSDIIANDMYMNNWFGSLFSEFQGACKILVVDPTVKTFVNLIS